MNHDNPKYPITELFIDGSGDVYNNKSEYMAKSGIEEYDYLDGLLFVKDRMGYKWIPKYIKGPPPAIQWIAAKGS